MLYRTKWMIMRMKSLAILSYSRSDASLPMDLTVSLQFVTSTSKRSTKWQSTSKFGQPAKTPTPQ